MTQYLKNPREKNRRRVLESYRSNPMGDEDERSNSVVSQFSQLSIDGKKKLENNFSSGVPFKTCDYKWSPYFFSPKSL